jgi:metal-responsive CopG/Arc/MetJ family transcriptional regulator
MVGKGAKIVPVSIERGLLKDADAFAKRHRLKRSQLVAEGLRLVMQQWNKAG